MKTMKKRGKETKHACQSHFDPHKNSDHRTRYRRGSKTRCREKFSGNKHSVVDVWRPLNLVVRFLLFLSPPPPSLPPSLPLSLLLFFLLISFSSYRFNSAYARDNLYTPFDSYFDANRFPLLRVSRVTLTKGRGVGRNNVCTLVRRRISFRACRREIRSSNRSATMTRARRTIAWSRC